MTVEGVITIRVDPLIHLGPVTIAWHGLTIAGWEASGPDRRGRDERGRPVGPVSHPPPRHTDLRQARRGEGRRHDAVG